MSAKKEVSSRSDLLSLLSEACELEHGLACSYLYAAFTLKRDLIEGDMTWQQLQLVRKWAAQIYFVASQEMLHLAQAWNLLAAIGGTPYYLRPNFPQGTKYYPLHLSLALEPFGHRTLQRFIFYESPQRVSADRVYASALKLDHDGSPQFEFHSVGELYSLIKSGFETIPESKLFIAPRDRQVGQELVDFPDIVKVINRDTAQHAIDMIMHQGEGTGVDRADCHFGMFHNILDELLEEERNSRKSGNAFIPERPAIKNPSAQFRGDYGAPESNEIEDEYTREVAQLFDSLYNLMLRMLSYVFSNSTGDAALLRQFARTAIAMMPTVLLPLGEALTLLPAGLRYGRQTAGPGFGISRHVPLSPDPKVASTLVQELMDELSQTFEKLVGVGGSPAQLRSAQKRFAALEQSFLLSNSDD